MLLESCSLEEAVRTAEALREAIRNYRFTWEERTFRLGASIGVVPISPDNEDVASLLSAADSACAAAKEDGRNRVHSFQENDIDLMRRRREMQWAARINNALEEGRFELFRHVDPAAAAIRRSTACTTSCCCACATRRARSSRPTSSSPRPSATASRPNIDRWVIEHALRWLVSEADEREKLALCSINLSGPEPRRRQVPAVRHRAVPPQRHRRLEDLLRDHRDRGDRELLAGEPLHPGAEGARLPLRARRLRHRPVVVRLPQALPGRLPEDRRQLRARRSCTTRSIARWCARSTRSAISPASRRSPSSPRTRRSSRCCAASASTTRRATGSRRRSA